MNKPTLDPDSILLSDQRAKLIAHLVREHRWNEWALTELYAIDNLHAELHEQVSNDHPILEIGASIPE